MYNKSSKAFTLIEVIIASSILSMTVFGIYKLIGENTRLVSNKEHYSFVNTLFPSLEQCIEHIWFSYFAADTTYQFHFGADNLWCEIGTNTDRVILDGIEYTLSWTTLTNSSQRIDWLLEISSELQNPLTKSYTQLP